MEFCFDAQQRGARLCVFRVGGGGAREGAVLSAFEGEDGGVEEGEVRG